MTISVKRTYSTPPTPTHTHIQSTQTDLVPMPILCFRLHANCTHMFSPHTHIFSRHRFRLHLSNSKTKELLRCKRNEKYGPPSKWEEWSFLSFFSWIIGGTNFNSTMWAQIINPPDETILYYFCIVSEPSIHRLTLLLHFRLFNSFQKKQQTVFKWFASFSFFFCLIGNLFVSN